MDAKALAKSKRAHSQHLNKKHHPNPKSKTPLAGPAGASSAKNPSGKQVREKPQQSRGSSALPSNWDRYDEEYDSGSEEPSHSNMSQATDVVPKSKGADYGHLLSEAKSQSETNISSESFPSFDDVLTDFCQGVGPLLSARGEGILSWTGDDNFVVEDKAIASHEASFLSLNLHLLAEQLEKVDLSLRLFIEPDLLPPELFPEESKTSPSQEPNEVQAARQREGAKKSSDELGVHDFDERDVMKDTSPDTSSIRPAVSTSPNQGLKSTKEVKNELRQLNDTSTGNPEKKSSRFEAAAAEAELDTLLHSFRETNFLDSSGVTEKSSETFLVHKERTSPKLEEVSSLKQVPALAATNFDGALDDLLEETSSGATFSVREQQTSTSMQGGISFIQSARAQPSRKSSDFPKSASVTASLDDALDDLLKETTNAINQKGTSQFHQVMAAHHNTTSSSTSGSVSKSKVLDDFDSWFDTV